MYFNTRREEKRGEKENTFKWVHRKSCLNDSDVFHFTPYCFPFLSPLLSFPLPSSLKPTIINSPFPYSLPPAL
jgi:hypothetical protein